LLPIAPQFSPSKKIAESDPGDSLILLLPQQLTLLFTAFLASRTAYLRTDGLGVNRLAGLP
jgi:hypothetical protein